MGEIQVKKELDPDNLVDEFLDQYPEIATFSNYGEGDFFIKGVVEFGEWLRDRCEIYDVGE